MASQRTEECLGQASTTDIISDMQKLLEELDVIHQRNHKILEHTEKMLKRNPGVSTQEYIYQTNEKKHSLRTNALIQLGNEITFAGRELGENTTYGKCLLIVGHCEDQLGQEELRFVSQAAMVFLTPLKRFMDSSLRRALKERSALTGCRLDLDAAKRRLKKPRVPEKHAAAEATFRATQAQYERQLELTRLCCENVQREKLTQVRGLLKFVDAQLDYFQKGVTILEQIKKNLLTVFSNDKELMINTSPPPKSVVHESETVKKEDSVEAQIIEPDILLPPVVQETKARTKDPFYGKTASEVSVDKDEIVVVVENTRPSPREPSGWSLVRKLSGQVGYVPRVNLEFITDEKQPGIGAGEEDNETSVVSTQKTAVTFNSATEIIHSNVSQSTEKQPNN